VVHFPVSYILLINCGIGLRTSSPINLSTYHAHHQHLWPSYPSFPS
jgi:hypothetical protein